MACNILFDKNDPVAVYNIDKIWSDMIEDHMDGKQTMTIDAFCSRLVQHDKRVSKSVKFLPDGVDSEKATAKAVQSLKEYVKEIFEKDSRLLERYLNITVENAYAEFEMCLDSMIKSYNNSYVDTDEKIIYNDFKSLDGFRKRVMGLGGNALIADMRRDMQRAIWEFAFLNPGTMEDGMTNNRALNQNIKKYKATLFSRMVRYLKSVFPAMANIETLSKNMYTEDGLIDTINYNKAKNLFYDYLANDRNIKENIYASYLSSMSETETNDKTQMYRDLVRQMLTDPEFNEWYNDTYKGISKTKAQDELYVQGRYSKYFNEIEQFINTELEDISNEIINHANEYDDDELNELKNRLEVYHGASDYIREIKEPIENLYTATEAYTILEYFDSILYENFRDLIYVIPNLSGMEGDFNEKYIYSRDRKHIKSEWTATETDKAEEHIPELTNIAIANIPLYNSLTGRFIKDGLTTTEVLNIVLGTFQKIVDGKIKVSSSDNNSNAVKEREKQIIKNILLIGDNPVYYIQQIFKLMCERIPGLRYENNAETSYLSLIPEGDNSTEYTKDVIKAIYDKVYSENNPTSYYSLECKQKNVRGRIARNIVDEVSLMISRNYATQYLKVFNGQLSNLSNGSMSRYQREVLDRINGFVNNASDVKTREERNNKYKFYYQRHDENNMCYYITLNGVEGFHNAEDIVISINTKNESGSLFETNDGHFNYKFTTEEAIDLLEENEDKDQIDIFSELSDIDINDLHYKVARKLELDGNEAFLLNLFNFIGDEVGIDFTSDEGLSWLALLQDLCGKKKIDNFNSFIEALTYVAFRGAYVNSLYLSAENEGKTLYNFLVDTNNSTWNRDKNKIEGETIGFNKARSRVTAKVIKHTDAIFNSLARALTILRGETQRSSVKDSNGNSRANTNIQSYGSRLRGMWLSDSIDKLSPFYQLWDRVGNVVSVENDLEVVNQFYSRQVKDMNTKELLYHAIWDKFYGKRTYDRDTAKYDEKVKTIQITNYSDKQSILNYTVVLDTEARKMFIPYAHTSDYTDYADFTYKRMKDTIGTTLNKLFDDITEVQRKVCLAYVKQHKIKGYKLRAYDRAKYDASNKESMNALYSTIHDLSDEIASVMHMMTPDEFVKTAYSLKMAGDPTMDVIPEYHYRIVKTKDGQRVGINEQIRYDMIEHNDIDMLRERYERIKRDFVDMHLRERIIYDTKTRFEKNSPILEAIEAHLTGSNNDKTKFKRYTNKQIRENKLEDPNSYWIDSATNHLIYAKTIDEKGNITYITDESSSYDKNLKLIVNPFLDIFLHCESLISNSMRLCSIGVEYDLAPGKQGPWNSLKPLADNNNKEGIKRYLSESLGIEAGLLTEANINAVTSKIRAAFDLDTFTRDIEKTKTNAPISILLQRINNVAMEYNRRSRYDMQTKRAAAIVTTAQADNQESFNGLLPKVKVAVINDEVADVYNYRGGEDSLEANDGSVVIGAFANYLESAGRGGHADGEIKKPVWVAYDPVTGTCVYVKYAGFSITNDTMRMSLASKKSLLNLHKKMTNIQWTAEDGIDLTDFLGLLYYTNEGTTDEERSMIDIRNNKIRLDFFKNVITENKGLYYMQDGERIEITGLLRRNTKEYGPLYYTMEKSAFNTKEEATPTYHLFYDTEGNKSNHLKFKTLTELYNAIDDLQEKGYNPHTINSLFELHMALGGINSCNAYGTYNESSIQAVVNMINNVATKKTSNRGGNKLFYASQLTVDQPLKDKMITHCINMSAIKQGARNVNNAEAWSNNEELMTMELSTKGLGQQNNAEKDVEDEEISEWTQVIKTCVGAGFTYERAKSLLRNLAYVAFEEMGEARDAINNFCDAVNKDDKVKAQEFKSVIYDIAIRTFYDYAQVHNEQSMLESMMNRLQAEFTKHYNHKNDIKHFAFDSPEALREFIRTITQSLNKAVKRKYPGTGSVLAPSYDTFQYFEITDTDGEIHKLLADDILKGAESEYKEDLLTILRGSDYVKDNIFRLNARSNPFYINITSLSALEELVKKYIYPTEEEQRTSISPYYTSERDSTLVARHRIEAYLRKHSKDVPIYDTCDWFMPSDVVEVIDENDVIVKTINLDSLSKYYAFKDTYNKEVGYRFRNSIFSPRNLRPATIRWKYMDGHNERYMNFFDLDIVRHGEAPDSPAQKQRVREVLRLLRDKGQFVDADGEVKTIIEGSLEDTEAEYIGPNLYKSLFNISDNDSLNDVQTKGEDYFVERLDRLMTPPTNNYDIALMKSQGKNTYIKLSYTRMNGQYDDLTRNEKVNENGLIYSGNQYGEGEILIGAWTKVNGVQYDSRRNVFVLNDGTPAEDQSRYRFNDGNIEERITLVQRCRCSTKNKDNNYDTSYYYILSGENAFKYVFETDEKIAAARLSIVNSIMKQASSDVVGLNYKCVDDPLAQGLILGVAQGIVDTEKGITKTQKDFLEKQINHIKEYDISWDATQKEDWEDEYFVLKKEAITTLAHEVYVSFRDSLKVVASRIPAEALNSFMAMKCVGFTGSTINKVYVSHFQLYLQGSDYDIDKLYMMGQHYDNSGKYAIWSPYHDFTSLKTHEACKILPMPTGVEIVRDATSIDLTSEIERLVSNASRNRGPENYLTTEGCTEEQKLNFLDALKSTLCKLLFSGGKYTTTLDEETAEVFENTINRHNLYEIPENLKINASQNAVMAAVYDISQDIANRSDQYTPDSKSEFESAAASIKNNPLQDLGDPYNPYTKYWKQTDNLMSKNNVGAVANGSKFFNSWQQYCIDAAHSAERQNKQYLKFNVTFDRIQGRSEGNPESVTIDHCPDLDTQDEAIVNLFTNLGVNDVNGEKAKFVLNSIAQYLSQSADNAKNPLLKTLHADIKFASMWNAAIILGMEIKDIAAFMSSPLIDFIDRKSDRSVYQDLDPKKSFEALKDAISMAKGVLMFKGRLEGIEVIYDEDEYGNRTKEKISTVKSAVSILKGHIEDGSPNNTKVKSAFLKEVARMGYEKVSDMTNKEYIQAFMLGCIRDGLTLTDVQHVFATNLQSRSIKNFFREMRILYTDLVELSRAYDGDIDAWMGDLNDFETLQEVASEMSTATRTYLALNQGLKFNPEQIIGMLANMREVIRYREAALGINERILYPKEKVRFETKNKSPEAIQAEQMIQDEIAATEEKISDDAKKEGNFDKIFEKIQKTHKDVTKEYVRDVFNRAHTLGIMNHFDAYRMMTDADYRAMAIEYLDLIKSFVNTIDMMYTSEQSTAEMDTFKSQAVVFNTSSHTFRLAFDFVRRYKYSLDDAKIQKLFNAANKLAGKTFISERLPSEIIVLPDEMQNVNGFTAFFDIRKNVDSFDMSTVEGCAGFRHFVENEFYTYMKKHYADNGFINKLTFSATQTGKENVLSLSYDTVNVNESRAAEIAFSEITRGMAQLAEEDFNGTYSMADIFFMYNLIVHGNNYGGITLTTCFNDIEDENSLVLQYQNYLGELGYDYENVIKYSYTDMLIAMAPMVSGFEALNSNEKYLLVNDKSYGWILMAKNNDNKYEPVDLRPTLYEADADTEIKSERTTNYEYNPYKYLINACKDWSKASMLLFQDIKDSSGNDVANKEMITGYIDAFLQNEQTANRIYTILDC